MPASSKDNLSISPEKFAEPREDHGHFVAKGSVVCMRNENKIAYMIVTYLVHSKHPLLVTLRIAS